MLAFLITMGAMGAAFIVSRTFIVVSERHIVVKERLGKPEGALPAGFHFMVPLLDRAAYTHEMREQPIDVPPQMCVTKDNIQVEVDGIVYVRVIDASAASYGTTDYRQSAINLAMTTMRSEIGKLTLEGTFSERDKINDAIVKEIDKDSSKWGIKVLRYEIKNITPSAGVIHTLEKQMEAERQKRAAITISTGQKESKVMVSEGEMLQAVALSEGERQKRINEANGRAAEIRLLGDANAKGFSLVAEAIQAPGGDQAVKAQIAEQYIHELGRILEGADVTVVPESVARMRGFFEGMSQVGGATAGPTNVKG
ncbi:MAG: stomatin-like protein [Deltaproteobacteria bacterium]|nr:stomatin-like protein [Deltaproteobacteria bacterium]